MTDSTASGDIALTRVFAHPRKRVWEAWTRAEGFSMWFGGEDVEVPLESLRYDAVPGADWHLTMVMPEGLRSDWAGTFRDVEAPSRLVMSMSDVPDSEARDTLEVELAEDSAGGTVMRFTQRAVNLPQDFSQVTREGWFAFFDALDAYLGSAEPA